MSEQLSQVSNAVVTKPDGSLNTSALMAVETDTSHLAVVQADLLSTLGGLGILAMLPIAAGVAWVGLRPSFLVPRTNEAYVVRGAKGTHVLLDGGRLLLGTRRTTKVILNEVEVRVEKLKDDSVRTMDSLKANIIVVFHVGVKKDAESVKLAASRLAKDEQVGNKEIREAVNARADDCIRGAAKNLTLDDIDMKKKDFEKAVLEAISQDLAKNGLEVLSVSVSEITEADNYNPADFLDAQGLEKRTAATETAKQQTFALQQATLIRQKETELETNRRKLELEKADADAQANHDEQVNKRKAQVKANVEAEQSTQAAIAAEAKSQSDARIAEAERISLQAQKAVLLEQESNKTVQLTEQARREKALAELKAAEQAAVKTAGLVAEAEAKAKADLAVAQASVKVAEAEAEVKRLTAEAEKHGDLAKAEGVKAIVEAQNAATTTAIFAQFVDKHGEMVVDRLPGILEALAPKAGVLGSPTIISSGQEGDMGTMLFNSSAAGIMKLVLQDGALGSLFNKFVERTRDQVVEEVVPQSIKILDNESKDHATASTKA